MLKLVFRENSEAARAATEFARDYKTQTNREVEIVNPDDAAGQQFIEVYDIVEYPTLIALGPDGVELAKWRVNLPTIDEASIY
jgi:hypothetical protein